MFWSVKQYLEIKRLTILGGGHIGIVTVLKPYIGYVKCTGVAKEALVTGGSVYKLLLDKKYLTKQ